MRLRRRLFGKPAQQTPALAFMAAGPDACGFVVGVVLLLAFLTSQVFAAVHEGNGDQTRAVIGHLLAAQQDCSI